MFSKPQLVEEMNYKNTCKEHCASPVTTCCEMKKHIRKRSIFYNEMAEKKMTLASNHIYATNFCKVC